MSPGLQAEFLAAVREFVTALATGQANAGLRVKGVQGQDGVFEITWAADGRATFAFGEQERVGHHHIVWRRVGTHDIFHDP